MDVKKLMDELLEHGCILQSREALAEQIIAKHAAPAVEVAAVEVIAAAPEAEESPIIHEAPAEQPAPVTEEASKPAEVSDVPSV